MRVQNISFNNYSNKNVNQKPAFKSNIHSTVKAVCHEGDLCEIALVKLKSLFLKSALESGKIKPENVFGIASIDKGDGYTDLILIDRTTPFHKDISKLEDEEIIKQRFKIAPFDKETEELSFSIEEKDICPMLFFKRMLGDSLD